MKWRSCKLNANIIIRNKRNKAENTLVEINPYMAEIIHSMKDTFSYMVATNYNKVITIHSTEEIHHYMEEIYHYTEEIYHYTEEIFRYSI